MVSVDEAIRTTLGPSGLEQLRTRSQSFDTGLVPPRRDLRNSMSSIRELIPDPVLLLVLVVHRHILRGRDQATADAALAVMCKALRPHKSPGRKPVLPETDLFEMRLYQLANVSYPKIARFVHGKYTADQIRQAIRQYFGPRAKSHR